jgi:RNA polymerase sigma-70 factor (ECF subfamily)
MDAAAVPGDNHNVHDDADLMRLAARGDEAAFRALVDRHGRYLTGVAFSLCGNATDAEDLVQETLVAALTSTFRGESKVRTWLVQILVRRAALLRRSRKRQHGETLAGAVGATIADEGRTRSTSSPATSATDAKIDLAQMLETLTPEHRQIIVLRELEGMSYEEMAAALGVPRGTVESRLHRARGVLKEKFRGYL